MSSELKIVVSEWRSVIAVSLNIGGGVRLLNQTGKTVYVHAKHYKHNEDERTAPDVCAETLGERRYENWSTHTRTHTFLFSSANSLAETRVINMSISSERKF